MAEHCDVAMALNESCQRRITIIRASAGGVQQRTAGRRANSVDEDHEQASFPRQTAVRRAREPPPRAVGVHRAREDRPHAGDVADLVVESVAGISRCHLLAAGHRTDGEFAIGKRAHGDRDPNSRERKRPIRTRPRSEHRCSAGSSVSVPRRGARCGPHFLACSNSVTGSGARPSCRCPDICRSQSIVLASPPNRSR